MAGWAAALRRTRAALAGAFARALGRGGPDEDTVEALEVALLGADVSAVLVDELVDRLRDERTRGAEGARAAVADVLAAALPEPSFDWAAAPRPMALLVVGVNGSGKTTTCAKLARAAAAAGRRPLLAAADTYRAAGAEQLALWAERLDCPVVAGRTGGDAAAVVFDAAAAVEARDRDALLVDTAGRMHTREPLMRELEKLQRALAKRMPGAPHETWIALDAAMGQNAIAQARFFHRVTPLTGAVVTKLDGSARAGFLFSIGRELGIPVCYAGLGEGPDDLAPFDRTAFVQALLDGEGEGRSDGGG